jgi:hypothetical protein
MELVLTMTGELVGSFGAQTLTIELPEGATLASLLGFIDGRFGASLPPELWNRKESRFRGPVILVSEGGILREPSASLAGVQKILFFRPLVGG